MASVTTSSLFMWMAVIGLVATTYGFTYQKGSDATIHQWRHLSQCPKISFLSSAAADDPQQEPMVCPYVRKYPRYRIDISFQKTSSRFWTPFKKPFLKNQLQQQEKNNLVWLEGQNGAQAFVSLWREAAILSQEETDNRRVLALPDCDDQLLVNWVELMDWTFDNKMGNIKATMRSLQDGVIELQRFHDPDQDNAKETSQQQQQQDDDTINKRQKAWVRRVLVDLKVCPFTKSVTRSGQGLADLGVPVGKIAYRVSRAHRIYSLMADAWGVIRECILEAPPERVSSVLLAAPAFDDNLDVWAGPVFALLEQGVLVTQSSSRVGVVCFHPLYATPDGSTWPGFGHMHSVPRLQTFLGNEEIDYCEAAAGGAWQRRTPHATINVLRADQLAIAESRRDTPELYKRNIKALMQVGNERLLQDLQQEQQEI